MVREAELHGSEAGHSSKQAKIMSFLSAKKLTHTLFHDSIVHIKYQAYKLTTRRGLTRCKLGVQLFFSQAAARAAAPARTGLCHRVTEYRQFQSSIFFEL